jgi:hypothetical protein
MGWLDLWRIEDEHQGLIATKQTLHHFDRKRLRARQLRIVWKPGLEFAINLGDARINFSKAMGVGGLRIPISLSDGSAEAVVRF